MRTVGHLIVPVVTKVSASATNDLTLVVEEGSMNCGRNARKNSATFGFRIFVKMP